MIRTPQGRALSDAGAGRRWPALIIGLISLNICIVAVTVVCATRDKSFAIEPDYYKKAVDWDRSARQRDRAAALGWEVAVSLAEPHTGSHQPVLRIALHAPAATSTPAPLNGAQVQIEAFAQARSGQRLNLTATAVGEGLYETEAPVTRPGLWEVRLHINRGPESLSFVRTLLVPGTLDAGGAP